MKRKARNSGVVFERATCLNEVGDEDDEPSFILYLHPSTRPSRCAILQCALNNDGLNSHRGILHNCH